MITRPRSSSTSWSRIAAAIAILSLSVCLHHTCSDSPAYAQAASPAPQEANHGSFPDLKPELAVEFLRSELTRSGADLERHAFHLILGFATSHYADDPRHVEAMERVAMHVLQNLMVPGDRVTSLGWEMDVWKENWARPYRKGADRELRDQWPKTPRESSRGGHDYNRSLMYVLRRLRQFDPEARDYAILFICPHPYSQTEVYDSSYGGVVGENNPELVRLREEMDASPWKLREIPFADKGRTRRVCLALVVPKSFQGRGVLAKTRAELLSEKALRPQAPPPTRRHRPWVPLIVLVAAVAVGLLCFVLATKRRGPMTLSVRIGRSSGQEFPGPWQPGEIIHTYVGPATRETSDRQVRLQELPTALGGPVLQIKAAARDAVSAVPLSGLRLYSASGKEYPQGYHLKRGGRETLQLKGTVTGSGVPMRVDLQVELELR